MAILDRFRTNKNKETKWLDSQGNPKTVISSITTSSDKKGIPAKRNEKNLKKYWEYYDSEGTIFASINTIAWNTVMVGYHLISAEPEAKKLVQAKFDEMDIDSKLLDIVIYGLVFGDSYLEKVRAKGNKNSMSKYKDPLSLRLVKYNNFPILIKNMNYRLNTIKSMKEKPKGYLAELKLVDPTTMIVNTDEFGREVSYQQKISGRLSEDILSQAEMTHFNFFPRHDSPYGISLLEPNQTNIDRKMATDNTIFNAVQRHTAKYVVTVGDKENIPPKAIFDSIKSEMEDINSKNEFIVPGVLSIDTIDEKGIQGVEEYFDTFMKQLIVGLLCPGESIGLGEGSTEASARVREIMFERFIKAIQQKLATKVRTQIINDILIDNGFEENLVYMKFNSVTDADEAVKSKWLGNLLRGFPEGNKPFSINEIRSMFDYPPIEGGDDILGYTQPEEEEEDNEEEYEEREPRDDETSSDNQI